MGTVTRYFLIYQDPSTARLYEGDTWMAHSFATEGERERMIHDLNSANSAWGADAVRYFTVNQQLPTVYYVTEGESDNDNND